MATLAFTLDQTDNGLTLVITDNTTWADNSDTGVTAAQIQITWNGTVYTVINESISQPAAKADLVWSIPSSDVGFSATTPFTDGFITVNYALTTSPTSTAVESDVFLDYNSKQYVFELYEDAPYQLAKDNFAYNNSIKKIQIADILLRGMQYSAAVRQTTKATDTLGYFDTFKKIWQ